MRSRFQFHLNFNIARVTASVKVNCTEKVKKSCDRRHRQLSMVTKKLSA